ncbi:hypothetical protein EJ08DRAFT_667541 [Tothia fuscella]|uniref:Involucrin repeat protein n=1 Tax=Tothia fuscella TaxID=1048955 RepID=A0A9P4P431_9PEZI|nr:hypothetical protein EJ08DRAFT_667541 [Tothia fuscella]
MLQEAKTKAEQAMQEANQDREVHANTIRQATEAVASRDLAIQEKDMLISQLRNTLDQLQNEVSRLTEENAHLSAQHQELQATANQGHESLQTQNAHAHAQWQTTSRELEELKLQHQTLNTGMEQIVRDEIANALEDKDAEIQRLQEQLETAMEQIKILQRDILTTKQGESFLNVRDEDWFDSACQQLCTHVQQWVLRFSKFSDQKACRLSSDIKDVKIRDRLDDAVLDGSDVDVLLADRIKRRDVFMSVAMSMIWEYVFTRYLFGMDREQRQKLKTLEKTLNEVGPPSAVAQWRAITLTLLSKRELFVDQRNQDTEAVAHEIYGTLAKILPPPANLVQQCQDSLRKVVTLAVNLAVEMRCQRAEYIMLPPLRPEYDTNGDLVQKVNFNASLMNERSGETNDNDELESRAAVVKIVLFPLVVKKGDDLGEGEDEIVVCPAQVLVAKPSTNKKVVRVVSGPMDIDSPRRSMASIMPESNVI